MKFEEALKYWGKDMLEKDNPGYEVMLDSVDVSVDLDPGYQCCGPHDWDNGCYCSMAEGAYSYFSITGQTDVGTYLAKSERYLELSDIVRALDVIAEGRKVV